MAPLATGTHFENLKDPRVERTRRHELMDIVFISILAVIWERGRVERGRGLGPDPGGKARVHFWGFRRRAALLLEPSGCRRAGHRGEDV
ncbi:transposase family protein [Myxococcota bacterium]